jgi:oligopeptide transport system ATP-binding protein
MSEPLLTLDGLQVRFETADGEVSAVNGMNLVIGQGDRIAVVGESGSGKSQAFLACLGLLARNGRAQGEVRWQDKNLLSLTQNELNAIRGRHIGMVFQDPMTALTPHLKVGKQLSEVLEIHRGQSGLAARQRCLEVLDQVRIPDPEKRLDMYPHELSGGMRQRVMIAMALLCEPQVLIADEPTTALDVTIQAEILAVFKDLVEHQAMALVLITHDLGVVAGLCERAAVMYAGRIVEAGSVADLFQNPAHPYTAGLIQSTPKLNQAFGEPMQTIPGQPPNLSNLPVGCAFRPRCRYEIDRCSEWPEFRDVNDGQGAACHRIGEWRSDS